MLSLCMKIDYQDAIEERLTNTDPQLVEIIKSMVALSPHTRITADELIEHEYFEELRQKK